MMTVSHRIRLVIRDFCRGNVSASIAPCSLFNLSSGWSWLVVAHLVGQSCSSPQPWSYFATNGWWRWIYLVGGGFWLRLFAIFEIRWFYVCETKLCLPKCRPAYSTFAHKYKILQSIRLLPRLVSKLTANVFLFKQHFVDILIAKHLTFLSENVDLIYFNNYDRGLQVLKRQLFQFLNVARPTTLFIFPSKKQTFEVHNVRIKHAQSK